MLLMTKLFVLMKFHWMFIKINQIIYSLLIFLVKDDKILIF